MALSFLPIPLPSYLLKNWHTSLCGTLPPPWPEKAVTSWNTGREYETEIQSGSRVYALTLFPDKENGFLNLYGLDITARKAAETQLTESRDHLEKLNNSLPDAIFVVRRPGKHIEYVNRKVEEIYGYTPARMFGPYA